MRTLLSPIAISQNSATNSDAAQDIVYLNHAIDYINAPFEITLGRDYQEKMPEVVGQNITAATVTLNKDLWGRTVACLRQRSNVEFRLELYKTLLDDDKSAVLRTTLRGPFIEKFNHLQKTYRDAVQDNRLLILDVRSLALLIHMVNVLFVLLERFKQYYASNSDLLKCVSKLEKELVDLKGKVGVAANDFIRANPTLVSQSAGNLEDSTLDNSLLQSTIVVNHNQSPDQDIHVLTLRGLQELGLFANKAAHNNLERDTIIPTSPFKLTDSQDLSISCRSVLEWSVAKWKQVGLVRADSNSEVLKYNEWVNSIVDNNNETIFQKISNTIFNIASAWGPAVEVDMATTSATTTTATILVNTNSEKFSGELVQPAPAVRQLQSPGLKVNKHAEINAVKIKNLSYRLNKTHASIYKLQPEEKTFSALEDQYIETVISYFNKRSPSRMSRQRSQTIRELNEKFKEINEDPTLVDENAKLNAILVAIDTAVLEVKEDHRKFGSLSVFGLFSLTKSHLARDLEMLSTRFKR